MEKEEDFEVIIIGGGVAGLSAALWCDELGLRAMLIESDSELGGQLLWTYNSIENHLGIKAENGQELRDVFLEQIKQRDFTLNLKTKINKIDLDQKIITSKDNKKYRAKALVIATGVSRRTLGIPGEKKFQGRGIIRSGKRDKNLVKDKRVLIVGGGDAALENAQILSETASEIFLIHRREKFSAREEFIKTAKKLERVSILTSTVLKEIVGREEIEAVKIQKENEISSLQVDAVLFRIGVEPNTGMFQNELELTERSYIKINSECETNLKGVFAIGDVANPISPTISSAVGMGATSIKTIHHQLKN